ncbi:hypothetical protein [Acinetobacter sp. ANC 3813]|uniref:hypothetical protein n=1 Tax=Acinetobacter sp. ANC 3813 TaxID=1977873 RepID=UPI000A35AEC7|nr:hypothetical protein [Acinetobacter sp. ANC 3813]OTG91284.1 hypothetical protein B9T34_02955 [Acinetobacter sp. ANC 3813]
MENFDAWIGKKEVLTDYTHPRSVSMMQALLNQPDIKNNKLPHLYQWFYFLPIVNGENLAEDGHPQKGAFLPPIPYPKRMWAGSRIEFIAPVLLNQNIRRESEIINIQFKAGKSGNMYFVTVKHSIYADHSPAIIEEQDIVYRDVSNQPSISQPLTPILHDEKPFSYKKSFPVNTVTLFRYSALTFNGHKIHYDRPYAMEAEGYPGLVVHGPLLATLLLHSFQQETPNKKVSRFEFRAVNPVFDFNDFFICGDVQTDQAELWIEKSDGQIAMKGKVEFTEV